MQKFLNSLKTGSYLTAQRIHGYSIIFIMGYVLAFSFVLMQRDGIIDKTGAEERTIGSDFTRPLSKLCLTIHNCIYPL